MNSEGYWFSAERNYERNEIVASFDRSISFTTRSIIEVTEFSFPLENTYNMLAEYDCKVWVGNTPIFVPHGMYSNMDDLVTCLNEAIAPFDVAFQVELNHRITSVNLRTDDTSVKITRNLAGLFGFDKTMGENEFAILPKGRKTGTAIYDADIGMSSVKLTCGTVYDPIMRNSFGKLSARNTRNLSWTGSRKKRCINRTTDELVFHLRNSKKRCGAS